MKTIIINCNVESYIKLLSDEDIAQLFKSLFAYVNRNERLNLSQNAQYVFDIIRKSIDKAEIDEGTKNIDYKSIQDLYNSICVSLPACKNLSTKRKQAIKKSVTTYGIDKIEECFIKAENSEFLKGSTKKTWHADFDWLINETNIAKVLDGKYDLTVEYAKEKKLDNASFANERQYTKEELDAIFANTDDVDDFLEKLH